jgi:hypothetical protein
MAENYIEMAFITVGPEAHARAVEQLATMTVLKVVQDHTRERGWFQRSRLLVPEWDCRIVLRVRGREDDASLGTRTGDVTHPYRTLEYEGDKTLQVPAALLELSESLNASYASVRAARLRFETRDHYEDELLEALVVQLEQLGEGQARATFQREHGRLFGRIESRVEFVDDLAAQVRRSGLVEPERMRVEYH